MTNEEAKEWLDTIIARYEVEDEWVTLCDRRHYIAIKMAIKALEQEPCEDAISRQAALDAFGLFEKTRKYGGDYSGYDTMLLYEIQQTLEDLPSVTPKQRTGHWIMSDDGLYRPICNNCGAHPWKGYIPTVEEATKVFEYCPKCGARMIEPQESEGV